MVRFGRIERLIRLNAGNDRRLEDARLLELVDIGFRDASLLSSCRKDLRPVLGADVGSLPVALARVRRAAELTL